MHDAKNGSVAIAENAKIFVIFMILFCLVFFVSLIKISCIVVALDGFDAEERIAQHSKEEAGRADCAADHDDLEQRRIEKSGANTKPVPFFIERNRDAFGADHPPVPAPSATPHELRKPVFSADKFAAADVKQRGSDTKKNEPENECAGTVGGRQISVCHGDFAFVRD